MNEPISDIIADPFSDNPAYLRRGAVVEFRLSDDQVIRCAIEGLRGRRVVTVSGSSSLGVTPISGNQIAVSLADVVAPPITSERDPDVMREAISALADQLPPGQDELPVDELVAALIRAGFHR